MAVDKSKDTGILNVLHATSEGGKIAHADEIFIDGYDDNTATGDITKDDNVESAIKKLDGKVGSNKTNVDNYTVNGKKISSNPVLTGRDANVSLDYYITDVTNTGIHTEDTIEVAIKKLDKKTNDIKGAKANVIEATDDISVTTNNNKTQLYEADRAIDESKYISRGYKVLRPNPQQVKDIPAGALTLDVYDNGEISGRSDTKVPDGKSYKLHFDTAGRIYDAVDGDTTKYLIWDADSTHAASTSYVTANDKLKKGVYIGPTKTITISADDAAISMVDTPMKTINLLTQDMINEPDTTYVIKYDFDCNGATINLPDNCTLDFQGGTIINGTINGKVNNEYLKPEWFGAKGDGTTDDTKAINIAISVSKGFVVFSKGVYCISSTLNIQDCFFKVNREATIKAIANMDYMLLFNYTDGNINEVIQRRPVLDGFGIIDGNGKAKYCISNKYSSAVITNVLLENATVAMIRAIASDTTISGSISAYNIKCINVLKLDGVMAIEANKSDSTFDTISSVDCPVFAKVTSSNNKFKNCHPWLSDTKFWESSVVIDDYTNDYISCINVEADSMRILLNVHQDYSIVDLINCQLYTNSTIITNEILTANPILVINKNGFTNCSITVIGGRYSNGQFQSSNDQYDTILKSYGVFNSPNTFGTWTPTLRIGGAINDVDKVNNKPKGLIRSFNGDYNRVGYFDGTIWRDFFGNAITAPKQGTTEKRVSDGVNTGFEYYNTDTHKPEWWNGSQWVTYPDRYPNVIYI